MSEDSEEWVSAYIGQSDDWFDEWDTYYATESRSATIKRHMRWGYELDKLLDEFGIEIQGAWDLRMRMQSALEKLAEESK